MIGDRKLLYSLKNYCQNLQETPGGILITAIHVSTDRLLQDTAPIRCLTFTF